MEDGDNRARLKEILETYLNDTVKARELGSDGVYRRREKQGAGVNAQEYFITQIRQPDPATEGAPRPKRSNKQHTTLAGKKN